MSQSTLKKEHQQLNWFYLTNDREQRGPYSIDDLKDSFDIQDIKEDTLIWSSALTEWKKIQDIPDVFQYMKEDFDINEDFQSEQVQQQQDLNDLLGDLNSMVEHNETGDVASTITNNYNRKFSTPEKQNSSNVGVKRSYTQMKNDNQNQNGSNQETIKKEQDNNDKSEDLKDTSESEMPPPSKNKREKNNQQKSKEDTSSQQKAVPKHNTSIYITGLPKDIEEDEIEEMFRACGIIKLDPLTQKPKIKIYLDENEKPKGDGLVTYLKEPSVPLAIEQLNGMEIRKGYPVTVDVAEFKPKENNQQQTDKALLKEKRKMAKKLNQEKALSWEDDTQVPTSVILKHMFSPDEFLNDPLLDHELKEDVRNECEKLGPISKVKVFNENPEGVIKVTYRNKPSAERCVELMNGRYFGGRQITAELWDGVTEYKVDAETNERWEEFAEKLEKDEEKDEEKDSEQKQ